MTHFCLYVLTPDCPDAARLETVLWPWSLYNLEAETRRKYDFFVVGGRFGDALEPGAPTSDSNTPWSHSQKQKRTIFVEALRERAVARAAALYDKIHGILAGRALPDIAELKRVYGDRAWSDHFHADPAVKVIRQTGLFLWSTTLSALAAPRDLVLSRASDRALLPYAIVSEGKWHELDAFDTDEDQEKTEAWISLFNSVYEAVDDSTWVTVVDCHF